MRRLLLPFLLLLGSWLETGTARAQTVFARESFESATAPAGSSSSFGYTSFLSNTFDERPNGSATQYFVRSTQPVTGFFSTAIPNIDGSVLWACEGVRGTGGVTSTTAPPVRPAGYVELDGINIAGKSNVQVKVAFADSRGVGSGATAGGAPYMWESDDNVRIKIRVNGGGWTTIGRFVGDNSNPNNNTQGVLRRDVVLSSSAADTSPTITGSFQDFTFNVDGSGSTLDVMVEADYAGASEELAFDNIRVVGTQATTAAPVLANIESSSLNYNEGDPATQITGTLTVSDADSPNLTGGSVRITSGLVPAQDRLTLATQNGISGTYDSNTGVLTLTGTASVANYQAALRSVQYQNIQTVTAVGGLRPVSFSVTDGTTASNAAQRNVIVTAKLNSPAPLPYVEDFENDGEGLRYASDTWSSSNPCLGFLRTNANPYSCTPVTIGNISGSYYWYSEGTKNSTNPNPTKIGTLTLAPVNASGYDNLRFNIRLATGQSAQWETDDFVKFYYRVNGGSWVLFSAFYGTGVLGNSGELRRDTDLDGAADTGINGVPSYTLNSTMQNADLALPATVTGASVDFQMLVSSDGQEEFMFDRINITGTQMTTVNSIVRASASPTNAATVNYTVTFGAAVTGLTASNFTLTTTGTVSGPSVGTPVAGANNTWTVPVNTGTGTGTLTLNLANDNNLLPSISTTLPFAGETYTIDKMAPTVVISSTAGASGTTTGTTPIPFTVTFSENVTGFVQGDLSVTNGSVSGFTAVSGTTYTFNVTPTTAGTATTVNVVASVAQDAAGNGNTAASQFSITYQQPLVASAQAVMVQLDAFGNGTLTASSVNNNSTGSGTLTYTIQKIAFGKVPENSALTLTTPNGANFSAIRFASYGTPNENGTGNYTLGSCNAANSLAAAQNAYVDRSSGTMYASNTDTRNNPVLGDPCGGTPKSLAVQAAYSADAASLAYDCTEAGKTQYVLLTVSNGTSTSTSVAQITVNPAPTATITNVSPTSALRGAPVTVTGTNLSGVSGVTVNGAVATVSNLTANGFTFVVPNTATFGAGSLSVTTPCAQTLTSTFSVTAPALTATVSTTSPSPTSTAPIPFSVTFSQSVGTTFTASDVTVANGTVTSGSFSGSGAGPYTFTVTPGGAGTSTITVSLAASVANDANNTPNTASNAVSVQFQAPTIVVGPASLPIGQQNVAYTQNLSASGGTAPYSYSITAGALPNGLSLNLSTGTISGTPVASGTFNFTVTATDASATPGPYSGSRNYSLVINQQSATAAPVVTAPANGSLLNTTTPTYQGTAPAGSTVTVYVDNVSIGTTTATGGSFSLAQPAALTQGSHTVYATAQASGAAVSANSVTNTFTVDSVSPTVTISSTTGTSGSTTNANPLAFTVTFSESVTGFSASGVTVSNGTISGFSGSGTTYTFNVTPTTAGTATTVNVPANVATDNAGNGNTAAASAYALTLNTLTWTGTISSDWFTAGNWSPVQLPSSTLDVVIPTAPSGGRFPFISAGTANVRNLTFNSGATLNQSGGTLVIAANLTNNGTYQPTGGTVLLGNSTLGSLLGSSNTRFWNLTVGPNRAQQSTSASTSVQHLLLLNGNFATNGNPFTLVSDATGTAQVTNNNGVVNGNVTVQRYINPSLNPNLGYRHISMAVSGQTVGNLATGSFSPVVNPAYNASAQPGTVTPFPTVYSYDQSRLATATNNLSTFDKGWLSPSALSDALNIGQGYTALIAGGQTWAFTGPLNSGDRTLTLTRNAGATAADAGLSLVGNPYPSPLDWSQVVNSGGLSKVDGALYVFQSNDPTNPYAGQYGVYANGLGISPVLPQGQGFFVRVTAGQTSGTLTFTNAQRPTTYTPTTYYRTTAETRPLVQLSLKAAGSTTGDDAFVYFEQGSTEGFDSQYDARKLPNPSGLNLSTTVAGEQFSIDGRPAIGTVQRVVPLAVGVPAAGAYSLSPAQLLNLDTTPVYLRDLQAGTLTDLRLTPSYQFTVSNASALITGRFELVFSPQQPLATVPAALAQQVALYPNPAKKAAFVELPASLGRQAVTASLVDALGRVVRTVSLPAKGALAHQLDLSELATGVYALRLSTSAGVVVKKLVIE